VILLCFGGVFLSSALESRATAAPPACANTDATIAAEVSAGPATDEAAADEAAADEAAAIEAAVDEVAEDEADALGMAWAKLVAKKQAALKLQSTFRGLATRNALQEATRAQLPQSHIRHGTWEPAVVVQEKLEVEAAATRTNPHNRICRCLSTEKVAQRLDSRWLRCLPVESSGLLSVTNNVQAAKKMHYRKMYCLGCEELRCLRLAEFPPGVDKMLLFDVETSPAVKAAAEKAAAEKVLVDDSFWDKLAQGVTGLLRQGGCLRQVGPRAASVLSKCRSGKLAANPDASVVRAACLLQAGERGRRSRFACDEIRRQVWLQHFRAVGDYESALAFAISAAELDEIQLQQAAASVHCWTLSPLVQRPRSSEQLSPTQLTLGPSFEDLDLEDANLDLNLDLEDARLEDANLVAGEELQVQHQAEELGLGIADYTAARPRMRRAIFRCCGRR
jgi:hypothetical protein